MMICISVCSRESAPTVRITTSRFAAPWEMLRDVRISRSTNTHAHTRTRADSAGSGRGTICAKNCNSRQKEKTTARMSAPPVFVNKEHGVDGAAAWLLTSASKQSLNKFKCQLELNSRRRSANGEKKRKEKKKAEDGKKRETIWKCSELHRITNGGAKKMAEQGGGKWINKRIVGIKNCCMSHYMPRKANSRQRKEGAGTTEGHRNEWPCPTETNRKQMEQFVRTSRYCELWVSVCNSRQLHRLGRCAAPIRRAHICETIYSHFRNTNGANCKLEKLKKPKRKLHVRI